MKKTKLLLLALMLINIQLFAQYDDVEQDYTKEILELEDFNSISASRGINITFVKGLQPKAEIHIKNSSPENVIIEQKGEQLSVRMRPNKDKDVAVTVFISIGMNKLNVLNVGTGAKVYSETTINSDNLEIEQGSGSVVELDINIENVALTCSSASTQLTGKSNFVDIKASVGANIETTQLKSSEMNISANLGANVVVCVQDKITAKAFTGARIAYCGTPSEEDISQTLGGKVEHFE